MVLCPHRASNPKKAQVTPAAPSEKGARLRGRGAVALPLLSVGGHSFKRCLFAQEAGRFLQRNTLGPFINIGLDVLIDVLY